jgi:C_GCAxxG_C_C family probable redox protein
MTKKSMLGEQAVKHFLDGYNCAQSVLLTMFEHWNRKNSLIPKIATGFGSGIGRCGSVCGAVTGGVMAIGARYGTNVASAEKRQQSYRLSQALYRQFEVRHGTVYCKELIHYDLSNPEELEKARETKVFEEKCAYYVRTVIEILLDLSENSS